MLAGRIGDADAPETLAGADRREAPLSVQPKRWLPENRPTAAQSIPERNPGRSMEDMPISETGRILARWSRHPYRPLGPGPGAGPKGWLRNTI